MEGWKSDCCKVCGLPIETEALGRSHGDSRHVRCVDWTTEPFPKHLRYKRDMLRKLARRNQRAMHAVVEFGRYLTNLETNWETRASFAVYAEANRRFQHLATTLHKYGLGEKLLNQLGIFVREKEYVSAPGDVGHKKRR